MILSYIGSTLNVVEKYKKIKLINYFLPQRTQRFLFKDTSKKHKVHKALYWLSFLNFMFFYKRER